MHSSNLYYKIDLYCLKVFNFVNYSLCSVNILVLIQVQRQLIPTCFHLHLLSHLNDKIPLTTTPKHSHSNQSTMASSSPLVFILLALSPFFFFFNSQVQAQRAPAPAPPGPANLTGILDKAGQFTTLIRLMTTTQIANQITNQLNSSDQGLTVLAPTDNAFNNLKAGTLNDLSTQEQVELILYHVLPKFYSMAELLTVSNPVRTQATGQDGGQFGLNFTSSANQVNVSSGIVTTQLNNALSKDFPLAVYQVDKVLLPLDIFGPKPPKPSPAPSTPADKTKKTPATSGPSASKDTDASGSITMNVGLSGMLVLIGSMCIGLLL
ncbi:hypothetical protein AQUCO_03600040v1 [Aquilegia coerulea]|uniref:FAS1 domain-containing protein n=1 Tax=Aquilegia coerulea TaxID=218851 RepID=A0A2G5CV14_AQUCA|nr:hypothetical protein AQUCO_03600040v1 [Aquilegia coerulea]